MALALSTYINKDSNYKKDINAVRYMGNKLYDTLDVDFFPHIGAGKQYRGEKLKFLSMMIHNTLLVHMVLLVSQTVIVVLISVFMGQELVWPSHSKHKLTQV